MSLLSTIDRYDRATSKLSDAETKRLNTSLQKSFKRLEKDLRRSYPKLQTQGSLTVLQRKLLLAEELKNTLSLLREADRAKLEKQFQKTLSTASSSGGTLADELVKVRDVDYPLKEFSTVSLEAVAAQAKDGINRLYRHTEDFRNKATVVVEQGLIQGWGAAKVAKGLRESLKLTKSRAESIARTEISSAFNAATQARYEANGLKYVQVLITPSEQVCIFCTARNGNVYEIGKVQVPFHVRCRCVLLPWAKEWQKLGLTDDKLISASHADGLRALEARGLKPEYNKPAPFEKAGRATKAPKTVWRVGDKPPKVVKKRAKKATLPGAKVLDKKPVELKLPEVKSQKDFDKYFRAHVADVNDIDNADGRVDLETLEERLALHEVEAEEFATRLLDSYDDSFQLSNSSDRPSFKVGGLERNTLTIQQEGEFKPDPLIEEWHKSLRGAETGELVDSSADFRAVVGALIDELADEGLVAIHQVRSLVGDRLTKREFNDYFIDWQADEGVILMGGELSTATREQLANSIKTPGGGTRFYVKKLKK